MLSECQTVWIQIWVQTVLKGYRQKTKAAASKEKKSQMDIPVPINVKLLGGIYHFYSKGYLH